jgi:hypothetical protein
MFEAVAAELRSTEVPVDGHAIVELLALRDLIDSVLSETVGAFDAAQLWDLDGATSMPAWLRSSTGVPGGEAARVARTARRLRGLPATTRAWRDGSLSSGQVHAIAANVPDELVERFADVEPDLLPLIRPLSVEHTATAMRRWRLITAEESLQDEPDRRLHVSATLDGRHEIQGHLDAEGGAIVAAALRVADSGDRDKAVSQRQGDALVSVCQWFLDNQNAKLGGRHRPHINVVVDLERLQGGVLDGPPLDAASIKRLLCDAGIHRVVTAGESTILDFGRTHRTVPATLWSAVVLRDQHCRFPGCDRRSSWCEAHHLRHWQDGGATSLENLALLCSRHHHKCHEPGWTAKLLPDATFEVTTRDGRTLLSRPPPVRVPLLA